jgi:myo-inositol 2-dehydrogenase / D-chiro-inositol 1-dehydrogenase
MKQQSRRSFIRTAVRGGVGLAVLPNFIPARLLSADAPGKKIQVAQIGCGRMGRGDMAEVLKQSSARVVAVCDLDANRLAAGKKMAEDFYRTRGEANPDVKILADYRELLTLPEVDAVVISVPDHSHALVAVAAALAGKHLYVQKPVTYSIAEAIGLRRAVHAKPVILQTGSQQRSEHPWKTFRLASEAVRNGRIGRLKTIKIGIGLDKPSGHKPEPMPVPANLDFERWLGPAPEQPYLERRVHPQNSLDGRPGWITTEDFGLGMITNWGSHHVDIAQWAMGQELGGPLTVDGRAEFMTDDAWTVHTTYHVEMQYPGDVLVILDNQFENGLRFEGDEGWIFCARGDEKVTTSDPKSNAGRGSVALRASDPKILSPLTGNATRWAPSPSHYANWLECILANRQPIAPIDQSARSLEACAVAWISMKLKRKLTWNAATEMFVGDDAANALRERRARKPEYDYYVALVKAGLA